MLLLHSRELYREVADFDPDTGEFRVKPRLPEQTRNLFGGHFGRIGSLRAVLYKTASTLWLRLDGKVFRISGDAAASVQWHRNGEKVRFAISDGVSQPVSVDYVPERADPSGLTAHDEDENWDFGLFVYNVAGDHARQGRLYEPLDPKA